eukprot:CAMPEP_0168410732 /NCGR_PEP_ID=MMETSP0228-20121227/27842_1 /TAXON_ID=133427 /ORGANISM="Protoceratium reticulatum, Strain CCCM 535 (=CCMP 1889)" /LENGTH=241 /DNA_ID=CAMNT_0008424467 /DNA_START=59 /DNA_END=781 /DNA_ORIENTATION=-
MSGTSAHGSRPSWRASWSATASSSPRRKAIQCVVARKEQVVQEKKREVEQHLDDRQQIERTFEQKYDAICRGLARERDQAETKREAQKRELERVVEEEQKTTQAVSNEEAKCEKLRTSLEQTVAQLDEVRTNIANCQALVDEWSRGPPALAASPEVLHTMRRIEDTLRARDQLRAQQQTVRAEALLAEDEITRQRAYTMKLEDFVRRISSGGGRYILDAPSRREATRLLAAAARLRAAAGL